MKKYFGTDGVRGTANIDPLSPERVFEIGRASANVMLKNTGKEVRVVIGKDTRLSGDMLEAAFSAGVCSFGGNVLSVGVMPTPAIAYLTKALNADMGVVISASHNSYEDNGIKIFSNDGLKLPDEKELEIEKLLDKTPGKRPTGKEIGRIINTNGAEEKYLSFIKESLDGYINLQEMKIAVDCANGATSYIVPKLFRDLGAEVISYNNEPDGMNINRQCGSLYPEFIREKVLSHKADIGLTFDGDGDRLIVVDETGEIRDGDFIMAICAKYLIEENRLPNKKIVATVMSNLGFDEAIEKIGGELTKTKVGDRYVLEEMMLRGAYLGGEQSGHIIFLKHNTTGDGVLTATQLIGIICRAKKSLSEISGCMKKYPQILINIPIKERKDPFGIPEIKNVISDAEKKLGDSGRVLVRLSGTEPLVRVMLEGKDKEEIERLGQEIVNVIREKIAK
jgi:phosphoglucosamine mutase